ncbi:adenosine deaminase [Conglomerata obtusa]
MSNINRIKTNEEEAIVTYEKYFTVELENTEIASLVKTLSKLTAIKHFLKRVKRENKKNYVLIQQANKSISYEIEELLKSKSIILKDVPMHIPLTRQQYAEASAVWPCHYFPYKEEKLNMDFCKIMCNNLIDRNLVQNTNQCSKVCLIVSNKVVLADEEDFDHPFLHAVFRSVEKVSQSKIGYLCTNYDAYLYYEPCIACAMSLVHGRIKRIFYIKDREDINAPISKLKLCYNKSLNHRYKAYKMYV